MQYVQCNSWEHTKLRSSAKQQYINQIFYCEPLISYICQCLQTLRPCCIIDFMRVWLLKIQPSNVLALLKLNWILKVTRVSTSVLPFFSPQKPFFACSKLCRQYNKFFCLGSFIQILFTYLLSEIIFNIFIHIIYIFSSVLHTIYYLITVHYHLYILAYII